MTLTDIVRNKKARFIHYRDGNFIYETDDGFQFPIPLEDVEKATLLAEDKALIFMRWIRRQVKALEEADAC
ncbi:MAG: hypothetical protein AB1705_21725 [Verrucomicrobiota bacterium]